MLGGGSQRRAEGRRIHHAERRRPHRLFQSLNTTHETEWSDADSDAGSHSPERVRLRARGRQMRIEGEVRAGRLRRIATLGVAVVLCMSARKEEICCIAVRGDVLSLSMIPRNHRTSASRTSP